jgi:hypothetical protein
MTVESNLDKVKNTLDKDLLLRAYMEIDELFILSKDKNNWYVSSKLNFILNSLEKSTGYTYYRTLKKIEEVEKEKNDSSKK